MKFTALLLVTIILAILLLFANWVTSRFNPDFEKISFYECGFSGFNQQTRSPFSIHFFIVAILFMIFDIEVLYFYPYVVGFGDLLGFWVFFIFFLVLTIAFVYEFGKGVLYFTLLP